MPGIPVMQAAQAVPVAGMPAMATPATYRIEFKLSNFPTKNQTIGCPALMVLDNQKGVVSMGVGVGEVEPKKPARHYQMEVEARVRENRGSSVLVDLGINMTQHQPGPGAMRKLRTQRQLPLGKAVEVVLADGGPEPICAEVKVETVPLPMAAPVAFVSPCPDGVACQRIGVDFTSNPPVFHRPVSQMPKAFFSGNQLPEPTPIGFPSTTPENPIRLTSATTKAARLLRNTRLRVIREGEKSKLQCEEESGNLTCSRMTRDMGQAGTLHLSASKERVHLCGVDWKAQADQVEIREDGRVVLRGHAKISCEKMGTGATIRAEECCFMVRNGAFEKILSK